MRDMVVVVGTRYNPHVKAVIVRIQHDQGQSNFEYTLGLQLWVVVATGK